MRKSMQKIKKNVQHNVSACNTYRLTVENKLYAGTGGISQTNCCLGFAPGFMNQETGEVVVSRFADGRCAPIHCMDGLPKEWMSTAIATDCDALTIKDCVISGFIRHGQFFSRAEVAKLLSH